MYDTILVPTDGSKGARNAAENAIRIAKRHDSTIHTIYVMDMGDAAFVATPSDIRETPQRLEQKGLEYTREIEEVGEEAGVPVVSEVRTGIPTEEILEYVEDHDVDLIVMGKRGRSDPDKPAFGTITNRIVGKTEALVLTV